jgi:phosphoribosylaminoimidazolecarboxamide formyltransferase/IMP cyclohydrolase
MERQEDTLKSQPEWQNGEFMPKVQRALISVSDKTGLLDFARGLADLGIEIVSTGGTYKLLKEAGVSHLKEVSELTGFPEMLDGRVKTIHPRVAAGILAIRGNEDHMAAIAQHGLPLIDLVIVNLYPFEKVAANPNASLHELIENIDIGGPTMVRAAAKNYQDIGIVTSPDDYALVLEELRGGGQLKRDTLWRLAKKAFGMTAAYDRAISAKLATIGADPEPLPRVLDLHVPRTMTLRYGENPHQQAALYTTSSTGIAGGRQLQGKELSYNNLVDLDAAWQLICEFSDPASAIIKHTNPCGCAEAATLADSYRMAFEADPVSAFGGVLAFNRAVDRETAEEIAKTFIEAIAAPGYDPGALEVLASKKNLRLLEVTAARLDPVIRTVTGGLLVQTADTGTFDNIDPVVKTEREPTDEEWAGLRFGWKVVKHVKSNAIVYARAGRLIAAGAGQMSRIDSVRFGAEKAVLPLDGCVLASDAFFPFPDGLEEAVRQGVTAVIQPGGSVRDEEVIAAANRLGVAMVFTGMRHFRH